MTVMLASTGTFSWNTLRSTFCCVCSAKLNLKAGSGLVPHALPYFGWQKLRGVLGARLVSLTLLYQCGCCGVGPNAKKVYNLVWNVQVQSGIHLCCMGAKPLNCWVGTKVTILTPPELIIHKYLPYLNIPDS